MLPEKRDWIGGTIRSRWTLSRATSTAFSWAGTLPRWAIRKGNCALTCAEKCAQLLTELQVRLRKAGIKGKPALYVLVHIEDTDEEE